MKKNGFTLAEVLTALVVLGVIAAITVPTLIQNTQKKEYVSGLKKAYSMLSQVTNQIMAEEGSPQDWKETPYDLYRKYLITAKECGTGSGCWMDNYKSFDGSPYWLNINTSRNYLKLMTADGVSLFFGNGLIESCSDYRDDSKDSNFCANIYVDINGARKPNQAGRDYFFFVLKENGLVPAGCNADEKYWSCKVLRENAMNY